MDALYNDLFNRDELIVDSASDSDGDSASDQDSESNDAALNALFERDSSLRCDDCRYRERLCARCKRRLRNHGCLTGNCSSYGGKSTLERVTRSYQSGSSTRGSALGGDTRGVVDLGGAGREGVGASGSSRSGVDPAVNAGDGWNLGGGITEDDSQSWGCSEGWSRRSRWEETSASESYTWSGEHNTEVDIRRHEEETTTTRSRSHGITRNLGDIEADTIGAAMYSHISRQVQTRHGGTWHYRQQGIHPGSSRRRARNYNHCRTRPRDPSPKPPSPFERGLIQVVYSQPYTRGTGHTMGLGAPRLPNAHDVAKWRDFGYKRAVLRCVGIVGFTEVVLKGSSEKLDPRVVLRWLLFWEWPRMVVARALESLRAYLGVCPRVVGISRGLGQDGGRGEID